MVLYKNVDHYDPSSATESGAYYELQYKVYFENFQNTEYWDVPMYGGYRKIWIGTGIFLSFLPMANSKFEVTPMKSVDEIIKIQSIWR